MYYVSSRSNETYLLGIANALRDENAFIGPFRKQIYFECRESSDLLSSHVATAFRDSLKVNTWLTRITLEVKSSEILSTLFLGVAGSTSIKELHLYKCCSLCAQDLQNLVATLRQSTSRLESICINHTQLGDEAATVLANALADGSLRRLKILIIFDGCGITSMGAAEIARGLETNTTLEYFSIDSIGDEGAIALANALSGHNKTLKKLILHDFNCSLTNVGAFALAGMLKRNNTLEYLDLLYSRRGITDEGEHALVRATAYNTSLVVLRMRNLETNSDSVVEQQRVEHSLEINRFRKEYLSHDLTVISPYLYPFVFARVSDKPSMLFLCLQENPSMLIPYLVPDPFTSTGLSKAP
jgi:hypothetical protein